MPEIIDAYEAQMNIIKAMEDIGSRDDATIMNCVRVGIAATPRIKRDVRRGHWKLYVNKGSIEVFCSECEHGSEALGDDQYESLCCFATRYCPECGAYMSTDYEPSTIVNNKPDYVSKDVTYGVNII